MKLGNNYAREQLDEWIQRKEAQETNRYMMLENELIPGIQHNFWWRDDTKWRPRCRNKPTKEAWGWGWWGWWGWWWDGGKWIKQNNYDNNNKEIQLRSTSEIYPTEWRRLDRKICHDEMCRLLSCLVFWIFFFFVFFSIFNFVRFNWCIPIFLREC